jgi:hypothetical protein
MLKLARNLIVLGLIVAVLSTLILMASPHDTNSYMAAAIDKHRLLDSVKPPKIILVGGSNAAFSVDSEKIAEYFKMPVVNMGLNVGLGLRFMLDEVKPALRNGDILIIIPEYSHFSDLPLDGSPKELGSVIKFCPECISGISTPTQACNVVLGFFETSEGDILHALNKTEKLPLVYTRQGFNASGDMVAHLDQPAPSSFAGTISKVVVSSPNPAIELMNTFHQSLDSLDVRIFLIYPAIPINIYKAQEENFKTLDKLVEAEMEFPVIGTPQDFIYARKYFYDTTYHMNREGRELHTDHIIDMLGPVFEE